MSEEMTLLDMFAASAMNGMIAKGMFDSSGHPQTIATLSYIQAFEMMRERQKYINSGEENNG